MAFKNNKKSAPAPKTTTKPQSSPSSKSGTKPATKPNSSTPKPKAKPTPAPEPTGFDYSGLEVAENKGKQLGMTFDPQGSIVSVVGTAAWSWISKPDDGEGDKAPKYKITLVMDPEDAEMEEFHGRCLEFQNAFYTAVGEEPSDALVFVHEPDEDKAAKFEELGVTPGPFFTAKMTAKTVEDDEGNTEYVPVTVYNAEAEDVTGTDEANIWAGDKVRVEFSLAGYSNPKNEKIGTGVAVYLRAVQLIEEGPRKGKGSKAGSKFRPTGNSNNKFKKPTNAKKPVEADEETGNDEGGEDIPF